MSVPTPISGHAEPVAATKPAVVGTWMLADTLFREHLEVLDMSALAGRQCQSSAGRVRSADGWIFAKRLLAEMRRGLVTISAIGMRGLIAQNIFSRRGRISSSGHATQLA